jgi:hypothetical protein
MTWFRRRPHVQSRTGTQPYRDTSTKVVDPVMEEINREFKKMQGHQVPDLLEKLPNKK